MFYSAIEILRLPIWLVLSPVIIWGLVFFTRPHKVIIIFNISYCIIQEQAPYCIWTIGIFFLIFLVFFIIKLFIINLNLFLLSFSLLPFVVIFPFLLCSFHVLEFCFLLFLYRRRDSCFQYTRLSFLVQYSVCHNCRYCYFRFIIRFWLSATRSILWYRSLNIISINFL